MRQILAIVHKDLLTTFTDRNLLLIMLVTPLVLASIIGFAFGGGSGGQITLSDIPMALVSLDAGSDDGAVNYGDNFVSVLLPGADDTGEDEAANTCETDDNAAGEGDNDQSLDDLLNVTRYESADAARAAVSSGDEVAAVIIPANYTQAMQDGTAAEIEIYSAGVGPVSTSVIRSVTESIHSQFVAGQATISATIDALVSRAQEQPLFGTMFALTNALNLLEFDFSCAFMPSRDAVQIDLAALGAAEQQSGFVRTLVQVGSAQALFFALFTAQGVMGALYTEKRQWTLQRQMMIPMPRFYILLGKLAGVLVTVLIQVGLLLIGLTVIASIGDGEPQFIWGNPLLLLVLLLAVSIAVGGIGVLVVGISSSFEQSNVIGSVLFAGLAALGGAFGFMLPSEAAMLSPVYWGAQGFLKLSIGDNDILLNVIVLLFVGLVTYVIGAVMFSRREDI